MTHSPLCSSFCRTGPTVASRHTLIARTRGDEGCMGDSWHVTGASPWVCPARCHADCWLLSDLSVQVCAHVSGSGFRSRVSRCGGNTCRILGCQCCRELLRPSRLGPFIYRQSAPLRGETFAQDHSIFWGHRESRSLFHSPFHYNISTSLSLPLFFSLCLYFSHASPSQVHLSRPCHSSRPRLALLHSRTYLRPLLYLLLHH